VPTAIPPPLIRRAGVSRRHSLLPSGPGLLRAGRGHAGERPDGPLTPLRSTLCQARSVWAEQIEELHGPAAVRSARFALVGGLALWTPRAARNKCMHSFEANALLPAGASFRRSDAIYKRSSRSTSATSHRDQPEAAACLREATLLLLPAATSAEMTTSAIHLVGSQRFVTSHPGCGELVSSNRRRCRSLSGMGEFASARPRPLRVDPGGVKLSAAARR